MLFSTIDAFTHDYYLHFLRVTHSSSNRGLGMFLCLSSPFQYKSPHHVCAYFVFSIKSCQEPSLVNVRQYTQGRTLALPSSDHGKGISSPFQRLGRDDPQSL